jgi:hypothetical protein
MPKYPYKTRQSEILVLGKSEDDYDEKFVGK